MRYITIEQAARSNDAIIAIMLLCMVAIAAAAWVALVLQAVKHRRTITRAVKKAVKRARKKWETEAGKVRLQAGAKAFEDGYRYRERVRELEGQLQATKDALDIVSAEYKALQELASNCPAYATKQKKGAF